jgi:hypothetical protein
MLLKSKFPEVTTIRKLALYRNKINDVLQTQSTDG